MPYIAGLAIFAKKLFYFALFTSNIICIKKINRSCPNSGLWFGAPYKKHLSKLENQKKLLEFLGKVKLRSIQKYLFDLFKKCTFLPNKDFCQIRRHV